MSTLLTFIVFIIASLITGSVLIQLLDNAGSAGPESIFTEDITDADYMTYIG